MPVAAFRIEHRIGVPTPPRAIWDVLADLERWSEWNPYFTRAEGQLKIGEALSVTEALPGNEPAIIAPVIIDWVPDSQILWRVPERWGLVQRVHYMEIEALGDEASILSGGEDWYGRLARYAPKSRRHAIRAGITAMNEALRDQAVKLWQASGGAPTSASS
jgi:hypothetical protein